MRMRSIAVLAGVVFPIMMFAGSAFGQGVIVPMICERVPCQPRPVQPGLPNALPVKSINIETRIQAQIATTHVERIFDLIASISGFISTASTTFFVSSVTE